MQTPGETPVLTQSWEWGVSLEVLERKYSGRDALLV